MADSQTPATPAGDSGEHQQAPAAAAQPVDVEAITQAAVDAATKAATDAVAAAVTDAVKPLNDQLQQLGQKVEQAATAETVEQAVAEKLGAAQAEQQSDAARQKFVAENLADVPEVYLAELGDDPAQFEAHAKAIREQYKADLDKAGVKAPDVGGKPGGGKPADAVDTSKLSPMEKIQMGVSQTSGDKSRPPGTQQKPDDGSSEG